MHRRVSKSTALELAIKEYVRAYQHLPTELLLFTRLPIELYLGLKPKALVELLSHSHNKLLADASTRLSSDGDVQAKARLKGRCVSQWVDEFQEYEPKAKLEEEAQNNLPISQNPKINSAFNRFVHWFEVLETKYNIDADLKRAPTNQAVKLRPFSFQRFLQIRYGRGSRSYRPWSKSRQVAVARRQEKAGTHLRANRGRTIQWVIGVNNSASGTVDDGVQLNDGIRDGQQFVVGSLVTPPNFDKQYSSLG